MAIIFISIALQALNNGFFLSPTPSCQKFLKQGLITMVIILIFVVFTAAVPSYTSRGRSQSLSCTNSPRVVWHFSRKSWHRVCVCVCVCEQEKAWKRTSCQKNMKHPAHPLDSDTIFDTSAINMDIWTNMLSLKPFIQPLYYLALAWLFTLCEVRGSKIKHSGTQGSNE